MSRWLMMAAGAGLVLWPLVPLDNQGSDDRAAAAVEATGFSPWAEAVNAPSEASEPWLFAAQAAIGVGLFAWVLRRRKGSR